MTIPKKATTFTCAAASAALLTGLIGFGPLAAAPQDPAPAPPAPAPAPVEPPPATPGQERAPAPDPNAPQPGQQQGQQKDLTQVAAEHPRLKTFVQAVEAAGLTEALKGKGPYTVFAPSDAAFARVPKDQFEDLMKPENRDRLATVLRYHVVSGTLTRADLRKMDDNSEVRTLAGTSIKVKTMPNLTLNGSNTANIKDADVAAGNGVIHTIDEVLLPPAPAAADAPPPPPAPAPPGEAPGAPPPAPAPPAPAPAPPGGA